MTTSKDAMVQLRNASSCEHTCHTAGLCRDPRKQPKSSFVPQVAVSRQTAATISKDAMIKFRAARSCGTGSCQERRARKSNVQIFIGKQRRRKRGTRERLRQLLLPLPLRRRGRGSGHVQVQLPECPESAPLLERAALQQHLQQRAEFQRTSCCSAWSSSFALLAANAAAVRKRRERSRPSAARAANTVAPLAALCARTASTRCGSGSIKAPGRFPCPREASCNRTLTGVVLSRGQGKPDVQLLASPSRALASFPPAAGTTCAAAAIARTIHGAR